MKKIKINVEPSYEVCIEDGLLSNVGKMINNLKHYNKIAIVTDDAVAKLYLDQVVKSFDGFDNLLFTYVFPNGEKSKNIECLSKIYDFLAQSEITRTDLIIALGGGVCGDMVGYASGSYLRGVDFINIPTTLLSMVDSSVGGKTAVNIPAGKNQVGMFYQPKMVICDTLTLKTLSNELVADGVGEIAKYAVLEDCGLFDLIVNGDFFANLDEIIEICVKIKDMYVSADVYDKGKRQLLNLGHTLGHVIEKDSNFEIAHGKAVLMGLYMLASQFKGSEQIEEILTSLEKVAQKFDMPLIYKLSCDALWKMAVNDKKRHGNFITIARPYAIGDCRLENVKITNPINYTENVKNQKYDIKIECKQLSGKVCPPPSKSQLHRLLICAGFCGKKIKIKNCLQSEDILATINALKSLGVKVEMQDNVAIFDGIELNKECVIDCNECGSTFRFFVPICAFLGVKTKFVGSKRLGERGYEDIVQALKTQVSFDKIQGLPLCIEGQFNEEKICINGNISSQFVSGIMLASFCKNKKTTIILNSELSSKSYVDMTIDVIEKFGGKVQKTQNGFVVLEKTQEIIKDEFFAEVDYSNLAFWKVAGVDIELTEDNSLQADKKILQIADEIKNGKNQTIDVDNIPDLAPILGVLLAKNEGEHKLINCARLKIKECDRLNATCQMLNEFGVKCQVVDDELYINSCGLDSEIKNITISSFNDHRMAMAESILASFVNGGVVIKDAQVVKKSYPNFWEDYLRLGGNISVINIR